MIQQGCRTFIVLSFSFILFFSSSIIRAEEDITSENLKEAAEELKAGSSGADEVGGGRGPASTRGPAAASNGDEEFNFSWLDPDKKVYVLQNRKYRKAGRFGLSVSGGTNLSNPYKTEYLYSGKGTFWITEQLGVEGFYTGLTNSDSGNFTALKNVNSTALPFVRENRSYYGGLAMWAPFYAKINLFNIILYFDWYFNAGLGQIRTAFDQNRLAGAGPNYKFENLTTFLFGTGQSFYIGKSFQIRLDLTGMAYRATSADNVTIKTFTNFDFSAGVGYLF